MCGFLFLNDVWVCFDRRVMAKLQRMTESALFFYFWKNCKGLVLILLKQQNSTMKPPGSGLIFVRSFLITDLISSLVGVYSDFLFLLESILNIYLCF